jgi:hypothetical protein
MALTKRCGGGVQQEVETNKLALCTQAASLCTSRKIHTKSAVDEVTEGLDQVRGSIRGEVAKSQVSKGRSVLV